jgi:pimeloyl-ACP methyl ester carboxylesterase
VSHDVTVSARQGRCTTTVEVFGSGEPLLYLHGTFGFVEREFVEALARSHTVYVPAHPGFAGTTGSEALDAAVLDLVLYYDEVMVALGLPASVPVVGHSLGAFIGEDIAAVYPDRVRQLALLSPLGVWLDESPQPDLFGLTPRTMATFLFHDPTGPLAQAMLLPPEEREAMALWNEARRRSAIGSAKYLWPLPDKGFRERAYRVTAPTLLLWGESDRVVAPGPYAAAYRSLVPQATVKLCPEAGHMVVLEQPDTAAGVVRAFLQEGVTASSPG